MLCLVQFSIGVRRRTPAAMQRYVFASDAAATEYERLRAYFKVLPKLTLMSATTQQPASVSACAYFREHLPVIQGCANFDADDGRNTAAIEYERLRLIQRTLASDSRLCQI